MSDNVLCVQSYNSGVGGKHNDSFDIISVNNVSFYNLAAD